uniref:Uncharacterized protein n=1 Tax=Romanomermis culicivorax TaxID=13658 RepID=A0A915JEE9_ROMCU
MKHPLEHYLPTKAHARTKCHTSCDRDAAKKATVAVMLQQSTSFLSPNLLATILDTGPGTNRAIMEKICSQFLKYY